MKHGFSETGNQRYRCCNAACPRTTFMLSYTNIGCLPEIKTKVVDMALNASGIRDISRVLDVSPPTIIKILRDKGEDLESINHRVLSSIEDRGNIQAVIRRCDEAELDEMWSFVGKKSNQRWLWHAIDHNTGEILAYVFGNRKDEVFLQLRALLEPFGIRHFYSDDWGAYERHITKAEHHVGKRNTQKIERKHLTLRTRIKRLARKTICFSKLEVMHDIVIGLFINRYEFCNAV
jgi:insertion element IS1 protein InsB